MGYEDAFLQYLVSNDRVTAEQLAEAEQASEQDHSRPTGQLVRLGFLSSDELAESLSAYLEEPMVKINPGGITEEAAGFVDEEMAVHNSIVPVQVSENVLTLAICGPVDVEAAENLAFKTGCTIEYVVCTRDQVREAIKALYGQDMGLDEADSQDMVQYLEGDQAAPPDDIKVDEGSIIKLVDEIIAHAVQVGASDIHIEPKLDHADVRLRIDGILHDYKVLPGEQHHAVVSRIKILSKLDIAEKRRPQDGVIYIRFGDSDIDFRIATTPTIYGEGVVLRVLDQGRAAVKLTDLGFTEKDLAVVMAALEEPYGFVLSTGPTGSGKTTTMYAMINKLNRAERKIITIEDPVEYRMDNINQIPVNHMIGTDFALLLRSVLRQDPNIILVGEIRDEETAHVAVQAALTGHLLLSTLHTTDAPEVLLRLMEMGIEYFYVREVVKLIIAQRLVRRLCRSCKTDYAPGEGDLADLGLPPDSKPALKTSVGCANCHNTGFVGRTGVYETMPMSPEIKEIMAPDVPLSKVRELAIQAGMRTLWQNAVEKVLAGETSLQEIRRTVPLV
ncbi:MAG TPA: ATPase, T2SS/T4P/T4SS family [Candidatus Anoxymicrobiaceae bacterium]